MLMTPSLTSNTLPGFVGIGQDGIRHDLNRLYYTDFSRQGMIDPQAYGAPFFPGYSPMASYPYAPSGYYQTAPYYGMPYQAFDARYAYARPYDYTRGFEFGRPYDYARSYDYTRGFEYRPYDYARTFEFGRPYDVSRGYDYTRSYDFPRGFEYGRPYDYNRGFDVRPFEFGRPYDAARYETMRPQEFGYGRPFEATMPYFRPETARPAESLPTMGGDSFMVPAVNSAETPDAYLLVVELPGVDLKDVNLQIHGSNLVLNAFRRPTWSNGTITVNYHFAEGRFGTLRRVLPLPAGVLPGQIQANFVNGLLTIVLPKTVNGANSMPQASIVINSNVPTTM